MYLFDIMKLSVMLRNWHAIDVFRAPQALSACMQLLKCIRASRIRKKKYLNC